MKKCMIALAGFFLLLSATALPQDKAEKVYSIVKQVKPFDWYEKQASMWKKVIDKKPASPEAWLNFYTANRMARWVDNEKWKKSGKSFFYELDSIVTDMQKAIPNTFEYYYILTYNNGKFNEEKATNLIKAYETDPERTETYDDFISHYETIRDIRKKAEFCEKIYQKNELSPGIYNWSYNVLMSLDKNALLITNGDNDTYPAWILQSAKSVRPDVTVLNINLLCLDFYRDKIFEELKFKHLDFDTSKMRTSKNPNIEWGCQIIRHIINNSANNPVYFSLTLNPDYYEDFKQDIYLTCLGFKYSKEKIDNMALLRKSYENNFLLDYLKESFANDISMSVVNQINMNYIPPFLKLFEHYELSGEKEKAEKVKYLIMKIATDNGKESDLTEWFKNSGK